MLPIAHAASGPTIPLARPISGVTVNDMLARSGENKSKFYGSREVTEALGIAICMEAGPSVMRAAHASNLDGR
jgi:hypothetical protein